MKADNYYLQLGRLVANLHSLEFALRAFLVRHNKGQEPSVDLDAIAPGACAPENSFTNYDSLRTLLKKFNDIMKQHALPYSMDIAVAEVRDMIAHGRVASKDRRLVPMELVKFGRPVPAGVPVEAIETMDMDWLEQKVSLVGRQIRTVRDASRDMGQDIMREHRAR